MVWRLGDDGDLVTFDKCEIYIGAESGLVEGVNVAIGIDFDIGFKPVPSAFGPNEEGLL
ncbi:MAG: hypothetical protein ACKVJL_02615 [Dehalococcoidia bacterium]|jgi:hypothetical protein